MIHTGERARWTVDGRALEADAIEVSPGSYSILIGGKSLEARVKAQGESELCITVAGREYNAAFRDSRKWKRNRVAGVEAEGRQQLRAPMPGKIVLLLVKAGDTVSCGTRNRRSRSNENAERNTLAKVRHRGALACFRGSNGKCRRSGCHRQLKKGLLSRRLPLRSLCLHSVFPNFASTATILFSKLMARKAWICLGDTTQCFTVS